MSSSPIVSGTRIGLTDKPLTDTDARLLADVYDLAADVEALNRVAAGLKVIDPDVQVSQLYIRGDRYSYRCDCGCNVFVKHGPDSFQCNSCGKRYETE